MRNKVMFVLLSAAILLAGALAATTAARRVVEPPARETWSAGELSVPTVFGQTAEEVLFYPWSLYDVQTLYPVPTDLFDTAVLRYVPIQAELELGPMEEPVTGTVLAFIQEAPISWLCDNFSILAPIGPAETLPATMAAALEWNVPPDGTVDPIQIYLKDFPATANLKGHASSITGRPMTPVKLNFALSAGDSTSVSFLIRPYELQAPTDVQQAAAMARVSSELRGLFLSSDTSSTKLGQLLQDFLDRDQFLSGYASAEHAVDLRSIILEGLFGSARKYYSDLQGWWEILPWPEELFDESLSLDEFLAVIESMGSLTVQLVTTQQQIVVLFTLEGGQVLGAYYDIQLRCWSGVGYTD